MILHISRMQGRVRGVGLVVRSEDGCGSNSGQLGQSGVCRVSAEAPQERAKARAREWLRITS